MASIAEYRPACIIVGVVPPEAITDDLQHERGILLDGLVDEGEQMADEQPAIDVVRHVLLYVEGSDLFHIRIDEFGNNVLDESYAASLADGQKNADATVSGLTVVKYPSLVAAKLLATDQDNYIHGTMAENIGRNVAKENGWPTLAPQEKLEGDEYWEARVSQVSRVGVVVFDGEYTAAGITASGTVGRPEVLVNAVGGISAEPHAGAAVVLGVPKLGKTNYILATRALSKLRQGYGPHRVMKDTLEGLSEKAHGVVALVNSIGKGTADIVGPRPIIRRAP